MPTLALVTFAALPALDDDERPVVAALQARGVDVRPVVWTDGLQACAGCDAVVLRSCWDYHEHPEAFARFLRALDGLDLPVHNPPAALRCCG